MRTVVHNGLQIDTITAGEGPPVMLLHCSASGHHQWRWLGAALSSRHRVIAPNLRGYGATTAWPAGRAQTLGDAAQVVTALCEALALDAPLRLVGHAFGAAVALHCARLLGPRVSHLVLYEPLLPGVLAPHGRTEAAAEMAALRADARRLGGAGRWHALGRRFTDYFSGDGAWDASPPERQQAIADALPPSVHEWDACLAPMSAHRFSAVSARCLLLRGRRTRGALGEIAGLLHQRHAHWRMVDLAGCDHMAPLTQPDQVNPWIQNFLAQDGVYRGRRPVGANTPRDQVVAG